jgi:uncharacterized protein YecA (UPF0149 family)
MTIPEILKELESATGKFPMEAVLAAIEQREAITPGLLRVVEAVAEEPLKYAVRQDYMLHHFHSNDLCPCGSGKKYKKCCGK